MARMISMESLDKKIEKAQELVSRKKKEYDAAISALSDLLDAYGHQKRTQKT